MSKVYFPEFPCGSKTVSSSENKFGELVSKIFPDNSNCLFNKSKLVPDMSILRLPQRSKTLQSSLDRFFSYI